MAMSDQHWSSDPLARRWLLAGAVALTLSFWLGTTSLGSLCRVLIDLPTGRLGEGTAMVSGQTQSQAPRLPSGTTEPVPLSLFLLGPFRAIVGNRPVETDEWGSSKALSLVKHLALTPHNRLHREQLLEALWPDKPAMDASNSLRVALYHARQALAPAPIERQGSIITLDPAHALWTDVAAFEDAVAIAERSGDPLDGWAAVGLYTGDLLLDDQYDEEWAAPRREAFRETYRRLLFNLTNQEQARGHLSAAIAALQRIIEHEPTHEDAYRELMLLHAQSGRRQHALRVYEQLRRVLDRELDAEPDRATQAVYQAIAAGAVVNGAPAEPRAPVATRPPSPGNLPTQATSFVGRQAEVDEVRRLLSRTRLLTLTGAGGVGKTRLALAVAELVQGDYPDGAWLVELATVTDSSQLPQTVASALGIRTRTAPSTSETLIDQLGGARSLVVLDNCEHLAAACAELVDQLRRACPGLRVLATSREPFHVPGEMVWRVPTLGLPERRRGVTAEQVAATAAGRLVLERVRATRPDFEVNDGNALALAHLCHHLDGLPLALELAAARLGTLAVDDLVARLATSLRILTSTSRQTPSRHQTMQATIGWSYALLAEPERIMLRRLGVFVGGFTLEAVERVCPDDAITPADALDLLFVLIDKSLVQTEEHGREPRYRLLEPIRFFARQALVESGEEAALLARHARYYVTMAERGYQATRLASDLVWLDRLDQDYGNLRSVLSWSSSVTDATELRLAVSLMHYWDLRSQFDEGSRWLEAAVSQPGHHQPELLARALSGLGNLARRQGDFTRAALYYERGLALARQADDRHRLAGLLNNLGLVAERQGDYDRAWTHYQESLALAEARGDRWRTALVRGNLAIIAQTRGETDQAAQLYEASLATLRGLRTLGSEQINAILLTNLGLVAELQGWLDQATALHQEALAIRRQLANDHGIAGSLVGLGWVAYAQGDPVAALTLMVDGVYTYQETGDRLGSIEAAEGVALLLAEMGRLDEALPLLAAAANGRTVLGTPLPPYRQPMHDRGLGRARDGLGEPAVANLLRAGRRQTLDEALQRALTVVLTERIAAVDRPTADQLRRKG